MTTTSARMRLHEGAVSAVAAARFALEADLSFQQMLHEEEADGEFVADLPATTRRHLINGLGALADALRLLDEGLTPLTELEQHRDDRDDRESLIPS
jgi:hypothetical protein